MAIDLHVKHPDLLALCGDGALSGAMLSHGIRVHKQASQVLEELEEIVKLYTTGVTVTTVAAQDTASVSIQEDATAIVTENPLAIALAGARDQFKDLDTKILGYVGYLGSPSKDQLFALLLKSGIPIESAKNVAERLAIAGIMTDTGNHYLSQNKEASDLAATSVEPEIIKLLEEL